MSGKVYYNYRGRKFHIGEKARIITGDKKMVGTLVSIGKRMTPTMPEFELEDGLFVL